MKNKLIHLVALGSLLSVSTLLAETGGADLGTSSTAKESQVYFGADYGTIGSQDEYTLNHSTSSTLQDNPIKDVSFKLGFGTDGGWKWQLRYDQITLDKPIYTTPIKTDTELSEFGLDALREFEVSNSFYPYIKVGLGYGQLNTTGLSNSETLGEVSFNAGLGLSIKVIDHVYLIGGADYVYRQWTDITNGTDTISATSKGAKVYGGVNFGF